MESEIIARSGIYNNKLAIYLPVSGLPLRESHKVTEMAAFHQQPFLLLLVCCTNEMSRRIENQVPNADLLLFNSSLTGMNILVVCCCTCAVKVETEWQQKCIWNCGYDLHSRVFRFLSLSLPLSLLLLGSLFEEV